MLLYTQSGAEFIFRELEQNFYLHESCNNIDRTAGDFMYL